MNNLMRFATCALLIGNVVALQGQARKDVETVGYLCGKLVHLDSREAGGHGATLEHTSLLPNVAINLYTREKTACCENLKAIEAITTGSDGTFTFATTKPGAYWLVSALAGREFKLPFHLVRPDTTSTVCRNQEFEIQDSGKFRILRMVGYL